MTEPNLTPHDMIPLTPAVFHILLALSDRELHGYGIMKAVEAHTEGEVAMGPGTLYGSIKRMLAARLIAESDERPDPVLDDERRRYYRMTDLGRRVLVAELDRLSRALQMAREKHMWNGPTPAPQSGDA
ncbi:MAG: helix-turn-helix transcriptional regulator [Anaerolineae bacterium]|nr:helix-turn-helix transcriptional regulator [Anaerolineae bacterium]